MTKKTVKLILLLCFLIIYIGHWFYKSTLLYPDTGELDILGLNRLSWVFGHLTQLPLIDFGFTLTSLSFGLGLCLIILFIAYRPKDTKTYRTGEEHGSARFATVQDLIKFRDKEPQNDMILSQNARMGLFNKRLGFAVQLNKNGIVFGPPGDGKTRNLVKPNLMQANASFVTTDPKGLLVHEVGHLLKEEGYDIKVLDLVTLSNSSQFNVFHYMTSELDIDRVAESIINGTKRSDNKGEDFWAQAEAFLIRALIGYLYFDGKVLGEFEPHLGLVADLLRKLKRQDPEEASEVEQLFKKLEERLPGNYACKQFDLFMANFGGQTLMSVLAVTSARFSVFDHDAVRNLIRTDTLEMETWQIRKTAVFIAIPETDPAYNFIANLLFTTMFRVLPNLADEILQGRHPQYGPKDLIHLRLILDEFAQLGKIPYFVEALSSVRSREISIWAIVQAINQLKTSYRDEWQTILNNCASLIYLGTQDEDTMKYCSMRAGKQTIATTSSGQTYSQQGSSSVNVQSNSRDLMTPDEIARIGVDETLVFLAKQNVFRDKKYNPDTHEKAHLLADSPEDKARWFTYKFPMTDIDEWHLLVNHEDSEVVDEDTVKKVA
ncbi:VirD4-like conjugal transfer protein, CD1115 family [Streptococcus ovuberis]|uniref:VirD4-like conjugal transfer protein, CD1115 family n=1 Tax=Streptococcus ovuberis TaxID=1936207 RepID=UPI003CCD09A8